jgi:uncharacterized protein (DUF2252 family)
MSATAALQERIDNGRRVRERSKRRHHEHPGQLDRDPVQLLEASSQGRLERLIPLRYGRMLASPFAFYRGTASLQAHDLTGTPDSGFLVQACGDCHLSNVGGFATPERNLLLDLNDFDETHPAPWEWDVKRMAASFVVAARHLRHGESVPEECAFRMARSYQEHMKRFAGMSALDTWYDKTSFDSLLDNASTPEIGKIIKRGMSRAENRTQEGLLPKMAEHEDGRWIIRDDPPALFHMRGESSLLAADDDWLKAGNWDSILKLLYRDYLKTLAADRRVLLERFTPQDMAFKVVGVGSVGTRCLITLLTDDHDSPLFLQIKEARRSVLADHVHKSSGWSHEGRRVVEGQRRLQAASDLFLGWCSGPSGRHFYVRQLRDMKVSPNLETFDAELMQEFAAICGRILARAHARASGMAPEISGYIGESETLATALVSYATSYADQVEKDFDAFTQACRKGRLEARSDADYEADFYVR